MSYGYPYAGFEDGVDINKVHIPSADPEHTVYGIVDLITAGAVTDGVALQIRNGPTIILDRAALLGFLDKLNSIDSSPKSKEDELAVGFYEELFP